MDQRRHVLRLQLHEVRTGTQGHGSQLLLGAVVALAPERCLAVGCGQKGRSWLVRLGLAHLLGLDEPERGQLGREAERERPVRRGLLAA